MSVQASAWVWEHAQADGSALLVLLAVADAANREGHQSCQSVGTIARMARVSERTAQRALRDLETAGVLVPRGIDPRYRTTVYSIPGVTSGAVEGDTQRAVGVTTSVAEGDTVMAPDPSKTPHTALPQRTPPAAPRRAPVDLGLFAEAFDRFWAAYPRRESKGDARKAYVKAVAKAGPDALLAGAVALAEYHQAVRTEPRFVPHPTTWLNQERWDDTLPEVDPRAVRAADRLAAHRDDVHTDGGWANTGDGGWK